jgi:hypothetical protein
MSTPVTVLVKDSKNPEMVRSAVIQAAWYTVSKSIVQRTTKAFMVCGKALMQWREIDDVKIS